VSQVVESDGWQTALSAMAWKCRVAYSGRSGRPSSRVKTSPASFHAGPQATRSMPCASWCRRSTPTVSTSIGTTRVPRLVLGVPTTERPLGDLLYHEQTLTIEVDVLPAQPDSLTATHPGDQEQVVQVREPVVSNALEERPALGSGPGLGSFGILWRQLDVISRVVRDEPAFDGSQTHVFPLEVPLQQGPSRRVCWGPRVPTPRSTRATALPETVLVHTAEGPSGEWEVEFSVQPALFMLTLAPATTDAAEWALVNS
jgi:hypothetical protein